MYVCGTEWGLVKSKNDNDFIDADSGEQRCVEMDLPCHCFFARWRICDWANEWRVE